MLPFARMLNFGGVKPKATVTKIISAGAGGAILVLLSDSRVYGYGMNNTYSLGNAGSTGFISPWKFIDSDIQNIFSGGVAGAFLITKSGRIKYAGSMYNITGATQYFQSFTDLTDTVFSTINPLNIKQITGGNNATLVLMNDKTLYGCGNNGAMLGLGNVQNISKLTYIMNDVRSVKIIATVSYMVKDSTNEVFGTGYIPPGADATDVGTNAYVFTKIFTLPNSQSFLFTSDQYTLGYFNPVNKKTYIRGRSINGSLGNGTTNNTVISTFLERQWVGDIDPDLLYKITSNNRNVFFNNGNLWTVGTSAAGFSNNTTSTSYNVWTSSVNLPFSTNEITDYFFGLNVSMVVINSNTLYVLGNATFSLQTSTPFNFIKFPIDLPL